MEDVLVKLNVGLLRLKLHSTRRGLFLLAHWTWIWGRSYWSATFGTYGAETWTLRTVDQKHMESFEMWCWRTMEKIRWIDHVRNEEVLLW